MTSPSGDGHSSETTRILLAEPSRPSWRPVAIVVAVVVGLCIAFAFAFPTYTHRYRLTVEIDTPEGVRRGSSVIEIKRKDYRWLLLVPGRYEFSVRGEAVFVDLDGRRNVIALMAHGPRGENVDQMTSLAIEAYGYPKWDEAAWAGRAKMQGSVELKPPLVPTLVTFSDINDPKSARVVLPGEVEQVLGPGARFKAAWINMTSDPVTQEIERKLPWWNGPGRPAADARRAWLAGETAGPALGPEKLFERK
jgi:hypothetical protein